MFGSLLDKATGWVDQRFVTSILLPALVFWAGAGALLCVRLGWADVSAWWAALSPAAKVAAAGGAVAALLLSCWFAQLALPSLIRAYEGYWLLRGRAAKAGAALTKRQRDRWDRLDLLDSRDYTRRYQWFPPEPGQLLPTRLGNVMRAAEMYAEDRFGIDAVFFWPRLYPLLPDALRESLAAARASLEQMLLVASLSGVFAVGTAVTAGPLHLPVVVWLPVILGTALLAPVAHRAALASAVSYGTLIRAAYDTHRRALLDAAGLVAPATIEAERELWANYGQLLYRRDADKPDTIRFRSAEDAGD